MTSMVSSSNTQTQEFSDIINEILKKPSSSLVQQAGRWVAEHPEHSLEVQVKLLVIFRRDLHLEQKIQLLYVLHEFLKSWEEEEKPDLQTEWFHNINEAVVQCTKTKTPEKLEKVGKVLISWERRNIFVKSMKNWKQLVGGTLRSKNTHSDPQLPPRGTIKFDKKYTMEHDPLFFDTHDERHQQLHYRFSGCHFIQKLADRLVLSNKRITVATALVFYHKMFSRGIDFNERYKVASACLFLATKVENTKTKLYRVVREMCRIMGSPLHLGDEETEEYQRRIVVRYEMDILQGIGYELHIDHAFQKLCECLRLQRIPDTDPIVLEANKIVVDCLHTSLCLDFKPKIIAAISLVIAGKRTKRTIPDDFFQVLDIQKQEAMAKEFYDWKARQDKSFEEHNKRKKEGIVSPLRLQRQRRQPPPPPPPPRDLRSEEPKRATSQTMEQQLHKRGRSPEPYARQMEDLKRRVRSPDRAKEYQRYDRDDREDREEISQRHCEALKRFEISRSRSQGDGRPSTSSKRRRHSEGERSHYESRDRGRERYQNYRR